MNVFEILVEIINVLGYFGIFAATCLEYACFPVSSELLLPFIGYSVARGELNLFLAVLASTLGGVIGCLFCYFAGRFGEKFLENTVCKKCPSLKIGMDKAKNYFLSYGKHSVFIGRVFPIVRTYISIPAGMAKMNLVQFIFYTASGALIWNTILISAGYFLGEHWNSAAAFMKENQAFMMILFIVFVSFLLYRLYLKRKNRSVYKTRKKTSPF